MQVALLHNYSVGPNLALNIYIYFSVGRQCIFCRLASLFPRTTAHLNLSVTYAMDFELARKVERAGRCHEYKKKKESWRL
jgi:hypothetical protein